MENLIFGLVFVAASTFLIVVAFCIWWQERMDRRNRRFESHFRYGPENDAPTPRVDRIDDAGRLQ